MAVKGLVAAIVQFLTQELQEGDITADSRESLEVAIQCLESAYGVQDLDAPPNFNLLDAYKAAIDSVKPNPDIQATPEAKAMAEKLRNEGNALCKQEKYQEAYAKYTKAIQLDRNNAVYYCNRAAVCTKLGNHEQSIKDAQAALALDPTYSKAYGRLGLTYSILNKHKEAVEALKKAVEMEPDNESYRNNLEIAEEKLAQQGVGNMNLDLGPDGLSGIQLSSLLSNPALMGMAQQMLSNPLMQNLMTNFMSGNVEQGGRMEALVEAGRQLAMQMQNANPELLESLRQQMAGNQNNPNPSQRN